METSSLLEMIRGAGLKTEQGHSVLGVLLLFTMHRICQSIQRVGERLESAGVEINDIGGEVRQQFLALVRGHYLHRVPRPNADLLATGDVTSDMPLAQDRFQPPSTEGIQFNSRKRKREEAGDEARPPDVKKAKNQTVWKSQRQREEGGGPPRLSDAGIFWHVNHCRFHQQFRDEAIVSIAVEKINENQVEWGRSSSIGPEIYSLQIEDKLSGHPKLSSKELDQYLHGLVDDQIQFLRRTGDSGGGSYTVNFGHLADVLCQSTIESITLEQKQVADLAMVPSKEAKELLYSLLSENYITLQEIPKAGDYAPARTFICSLSIYLNLHDYC
eukprot:Em0009g1289a